MKVGDCASNDSVSAFLRSQKQKPVAMMNHANIKLDIPLAQLEKRTHNGHTATGYAWLWSYEQTLSHFDAHARLSNLTGEKKKRGREVITQLRDLALKRGEIKEIETGKSIQMLTASVDLKTWYVLTGNKPMHQNPTQYCLEMEGRDLQIYNYAKNSNSRKTAFEYNRPKAEEACVKLKGKNAHKCQPRDIALSDLTNLGFNKALSGIIVGTKGGGEKFDKSIFTVLVNASKNQFRSILTVGYGATIPNSRGYQFSFTPAVQKQLE